MPVAPGTPLSAKDCIIRIAGITHYAQEWEITPETTYDDTSNFEDDGFESQVACLTRARVRCSGWWDAGANPYDSPLDLQDGNRLADVNFYVTTDLAGPHWEFPLLDIEGAPMTVRVQQKILFSFTAKAQKEFFYISGNIP